MLISARTRKGVDRFRRAGHRFDKIRRNYNVTKEELDLLERESRIVILAPLSTGANSKPQAKHKRKK